MRIHSIACTRQEERGSRQLCQPYQRPMIPYIYCTVNAVRAKHGGEVAQLVPTGSTYRSDGHGIRCTQDLVFCYSSHNPMSLSINCMINASRARMCRRRTAAARRKQVKAWRNDIVTTQHMMGKTKPDRNEPRHNTRSMRITLPGCMYCLPQSP